MTRSAMEVVRNVLAGELNLALVTAPPEDSQITKVPFARAPLHVALLRSHPAAHKECIAVRDLAAAEWILPPKNVHPIIRDSILQTAQIEGVVPKEGHEVMTAHQAVHLVSEHMGVAILFKPTGLRFHEEGVIIRPLSDPALWFETCLVMRADDTSRLVNEFARAFLRKYAPQRLQPKQMELWLSA